MDATLWHALALELAERFRDARVTGLAQPAPRILEIRLGAPRPAGFIVLSAEPGLPRIELDAGTPPRQPRRGAAVGRPSSGRTSVDLQLIGARLAAIESEPWEREIRFVFARGAAGTGGDETVLLARLLPNRPILALLDGSGALLASWPPEPLPALPRRAGIRTPPEVGAPELRAALATEASATIPVKVQRAVFGLSATIAREIAHRAGMSSVVTPPLPPEASVAKLEEAWLAVMAELTSREGGSSAEPRRVFVYLPRTPARAGGPRHRPGIALVRLTYLAETHDERAFESVSAAARFYWRELRAMREGEDRERGLQGALRRAREHENSLIAALSEELVQAQGGSDARRAGELLVAHFARVIPGATEARLPDPYDPDAREVSVALDPTLSPQANAERYFRRARRATRALAEIPARLEAARRRLARIAEFEGELARAVTWDDVATVADQAHGDPATANRFPRVPGAARRTTAESDVVSRRLRNLGIRPRRFTLAPGWIALIGRTSRENDILTTRAAAPHDLWFHARGVAGSHLVLIRPGRGVEPPGEVIQRAATAAAWYSQGRTSSVVAVAWTEARYVRKPRGAPAGQVVLLREKVVMVEPAPPPAGEGPGEG